MHSRISALKARSGVSIGQPYESGLVSLYSAMHVDSGGDWIGCGSPTSDGGGRLRRSSPSLGEGGMGGTPHSRLEAVLRLVGSHTLLAIAKSVCDPTKRSTASNLLCGVPPIPPSPKEGDERLNLPPPSLVGDPHPIQSPPLSTCIAEYNDTKPLSYGCPIDTPDLAFKAEMRECIDLFRAGKRLKTWCPADTSRRAAAESSTPAAPASRGLH